jgi:hypothetical protein
LVLGQKFSKIMAQLSGSKIYGLCSAAGRSISLIKSFVTALTALNKALKTLTAAEVARYL